jgi:mRNA-degrading endonuclease RelE of RelBE toxin-antitoxin system
MYELVFSNSFLSSAKKLNAKIKPKLKASLDILQKDPFRSTLHTKPLTGKLTNHYSFRLGRNYRVIFRFISNEAIYLIKAGDRKDVYR